MSLRLGSIETFPEPFPHFVIDGVFDEEFYHELVEHIPAMPGFDRHDVTASGTMNLDEFRRLSGRHDVLGREFQRDLHALNTHACGLYHQLLDDVRDDPAYAAFAELVGQPEWEETTYFRLRERANGFRLPPHMDGPYFLGTHLVYLARDEEDEANGTMLFSPMPPLQYDPLTAYLSMWPKNHQWILAKMVPYRPNRVMGFLNTPYSLHGHTPFKLKGRRLTVNISIKFTDACTRRMYERLTPEYRSVFVKPKIIGAIMGGVDTVTARERDPEGAFAFLNG